jgi:hypothetical protein
VQTRWLARRSRQDDPHLLPRGFEYDGARRRPHAHEFAGSSHSARSAFLAGLALLVLGVFWHQLYVVLVLVADRVTI